MIGRGALGNPWIFNLEKSGFLEEGSSIFPSLQDRQRIIEYHFSLLRDHYGEKGALREIRRHLAWYTKGLPFSTTFRSTLSGKRGKEALFEAIRSYFDRLENTKRIERMKNKIRRSQCQLFASAESKSITG